MRQKTFLFTFSTETEHKLAQFSEIKSAEKRRRNQKRPQEKEAVSMRKGRERKIPAQDPDNS